MKQLYLFRHAKSAWDDPDVGDHDRVLTPRGRWAAGVMGRYLEDQGVRLDLALCSSAARARETWDLATAEMTQPPQLLVEEGLYLCGVESMAMRLRSLDETVKSVIVIAHNPDLQIMTVNLAHDQGSQAAARARHKFPTAGLARLDLEIAEWPDLRPDCGLLALFETPKRLAYEADFKRGPNV